MEGSLAPGTRAAVLATDGVERIELIDPLRAIEEAGGHAILVAPHGGTIRSFDHLDPSDEIDVDLELDDARAQEFQALVLPGGVASPDALRTDERVRPFVADFFAAAAPVAAICHPWILIDAGVARGRTPTSWPSLRTDLENAGATWVDREVCRDGRLITSRRPDDLPAFCGALVAELAGARVLQHAGLPTARGRRAQVEGR